MRSYVEREHFRAFDLELRYNVETFVQSVHIDWGNELRCHELVRAVHDCMYLKHRIALTIVDGKLGAVEHSWLIYLSRGQREPFIVDAYCPGRIPQVQLIHPFAGLKHGYQPGPIRDDINSDIIKRLREQMLEERPL
jgi:hypothetical protein